MNTVNLVADVSRLVDLYGAENIEQALRLIKFVATSQYKLRDGSGNYVVISKEDYTVIKNQMETRNLIGAIKHLRSITALGLKEAKDMVEFTFK